MIASVHAHVNNPNHVNKSNLYSSYELYPYIHIKVYNLYRKIKLWLIIVLIDIMISELARLIW